MIWLINDAATEPTLRDNESLRQKSLIPLVKEICNPQNYYVYATFAFRMLHSYSIFIVLYVHEFIEQGGNACSYGNRGLFRLLLINASCKELWDHVSWSTECNSTELVWDVKVTAHKFFPITLIVYKFDKSCLVFRFQLPIAYHGRASSIVISGTDIIRPRSDNSFICLYCHLVCRVLKIAE